MAILNFVANPIPPDYSNDNSTPDIYPNPLPIPDSTSNNNVVTSIDLYNHFVKHYEKFIRKYSNYESCSNEHKELLHIYAWNSTHPVSEHVAKETLIRESWDDRKIRIMGENIDIKENYKVKRGPKPKEKPELNRAFLEAKQEWRTLCEQRKVAISEWDVKVKNARYKMTLLEIGNNNETLS